MSPTATKGVDRNSSLHNLSNMVYQIRWNSKWWMLAGEVWILMRTWMDAGLKMGLLTYEAGCRVAMVDTRLMDYFMCGLVNP